MSNLLRVKNPKALKSMIFVARAASAMHALGIQMSSELRYVIENILFIIENNLTGIRKEAKAVEELKREAKLSSQPRDKQKRKVGRLESKSQKEYDEPCAKIQKKDSSSGTVKMKGSNKTSNSPSKISSVNFASTYASLPSPATLSTLNAEEPDTHVPQNDRMDRLESLFLQGRDCALHLTSFFHDGLTELRQLRKDVAEQEERVKAQMLDAFQKSLEAIK